MFFLSTLFSFVSVVIIVHDFLQFNSERKFNIIDKSKLKITNRAYSITVLYLYSLPLVSWYETIEQTFPWIIFVVELNITELSAN